ncbi:hypothetical protein Tco_0618807 [Tanacetum coccineum]
MADKYFAEYTGIEVTQFREMLLQHMTNVKKSVVERTQSSGTEYGNQDTSSKLGNDADADDAVYNEEPMAEVQLTVEYNVTAIGQQHTEQLEIINEVKSKEAKIKHDIDVIETINIELEHSVAKLLVKNEHLNKEKEHLKQTYKDLYDSIKKTRVQTKDHTDSLIVQPNNKSNENADLKAQLQEKVFGTAALINELRKLKGNIVDTKFAKPSVLGKPILQPLRNQSVVRQQNVFKSERPRISNHGLPPKLM